MDRLTLPVRPGMGALLDALDARDGATRLVGGAVRDALIGRAFSDIDLATRLEPETAMARLKAAGIRVVPTGLKHGTVTAVLDNGPIEVTTLRRDLATDGRHATVAYTDDWRADAERRDFTINALYADPLDGTIHDYFDGRADLAAGRVRFIGDPLRRIAEDHLRVLRFFRFLVRYGRGAPDAAALDACAARANDLMALSRERIADELLKLLAHPDPVAVVALMIDRGILAPVLPEIDGDGVARLKRTIAAERTAGVDGDAVRRLAALLPAAATEPVAARLRLSNQQRARLVAAHGPVDESPHGLGYRLGVVHAVDRLLLAGGDPTLLLGWTRPALPITGGALIARGLREGPAVAKALRQVEARWVAEGFPDRERVEAIADEVAGNTAGDR